MSNADMPKKETPPVAAIKRYRSAARAAAVIGSSPLTHTLYHGDAFDLASRIPEESVDLVFSSPPYCMGKAYETSSSVEDFSECHERLIPQLVKAVKPGGAICWQVGYHSDGKRLTPLDFLAHAIFSKYPDLRLRNRIVWSFAHGLHAKNRFSGRHEVVLWYTKGDRGIFNLDEVRVPQKYPGKRYYKGPKKGEFSGNPLGKNPGDVWEIPNVKGGHVEKTDHPCQFPIALPKTFIKALTPRGGTVYDPFMGVGSTGVASVLEGRRFVGSEIHEGYVLTAEERMRDAARGNARFRPLERPILEPALTGAVAKKPEHFKG